MFEKTKEAWQLVEAKHAEMMQAYQDYLAIAQEEGYLPKIGESYLQLEGWENVRKKIVLIDFIDNSRPLDPQPPVAYRFVTKSGDLSARTFTRNTYKFNQETQKA